MAERQSWDAALVFDQGGGALVVSSSSIIVIILLSCPLCLEINWSRDLSSPLRGQILWAGPPCHPCCCSWIHKGWGRLCGSRFYQARSNLDPGGRGLLIWKIPPHLPFLFFLIGGGAGRGIRDAYLFLSWWQFRFLNHLDFLSGHWCCVCFETCPKTVPKLNLSSLRHIT